MGIISDMRAEGQHLANADLLKVAVQAIQETGADPVEVLSWMARYEEWRSEFAGYADKPRRPCPEGGEIESWFREHKPQGLDYFKGPSE